MFYSKKNSIIKLNGSHIFANSINFDVESNVSPVYLDGKRHSNEYIQNGYVNGSLKLNYYLTGVDIIKNELDSDINSFTGNCAGLYFQSGFVKNYSASFTPNNPVEINAELSVFGGFLGQFTGEQIYKPENEVLNSSNILISNITTQTNLGNIISANYSYNADIIPVFNQQTGTGYTEIFPNRVLFDKKTVAVEITSDASGIYLPMNGQESFVKIFAQDRNSNIIESFTISGKIIKRSFDLNNKDYGQQKFTISQHRVGNIASITSFNPSNTYPGYSVSIFGSDFKNITNVYLNNQPVKSFNVVNSSQIDVKLPLDCLSGYFRLDSFEGTTSSSQQLGLTYPPIAVVSFYPQNIVSGQSVYIFGGNFYNIDKVLFGNIESSFKMLNGYVVATAPGRVLNDYITVASTKRNISGISSIKYWSNPVIDTFYPETGIPNSVITLSGANLTGLSSVKINDVAATFSIINSGSISITIPQGDTLGQISITNSGNQTVYSANNFYPVVSITGLSIKSGNFNNGIGISGSNFETWMLYDLGDSTYKVSFNGISTGFTRTSSNLLTGRVPSKAYSGPVYIYKPDGVSTYNSTGDFTYIPDPPVINFSSPSGVVSGDSLSYVLIGENLNTVNKVYLKGTGASNNERYIYLYDKTLSISSWPNSTTGTRYLYMSGRNNIIGNAYSFNHILSNPISFTGNAMLTGSAVKSGVYDLYVENSIGTGISSGAVVIRPLQNLAQIDSTQILFSSFAPNNGYIYNGPEKLTDNDTGTYGATSGQKKSYFRFNFSSRSQIFEISLNTHATGYNPSSGTGYIEVSFITGSITGSGIYNSGIAKISPYSSFISGYGLNTGTLSWRYEADSVLIRSHSYDISGNEANYPLILSDVKIMGIKMNR